VTDIDLGQFARPIRTAGPWGVWWRATYRLVRIADGLVARLAAWRRIANVVVLRVTGRRSGRERSVPLGLLAVDGRIYIGHPNGDTAWTLNLRAAPWATIESAQLPRTRVRPVLLGPGPERDAVVRATFRQHPYPGKVFYRLSGRHVARTGVFFRLERDIDADQADPAAPNGPAGRAARPFPTA
jgi:hypothetical protein